MELWPRLAMRLRGGRTARQRQRLLALFGRDDCRDIDRLTQAIIANHSYAQLQILRSYRIGGWRPRIDLAGREHVLDALAKGRGAILWVAPFWSALATKMAFAQAGFQVSHLSRSGHGFAQSRIGVRILNPIWTSVERRYLAERLVIGRTDATRILVELLRRLRANRLISISLSPQGRRTYAVPVLRGGIWIADGAPALAHRTGAALLPVFTVRTGDDAFVITIEPPLAAAGDRDQATGVRTLLAGYAPLLESYITRWPDQFIDLEWMVV